MHLLILSGRSGSGKTIVLNALEDLGFYCIDNLPLAFLPDLVHHLGREHRDVAVSIDARNIVEELKFFHDVINSLNKEAECSVVYLDASDEILLKRFSETRRKHPLTDGNMTLQEAIRQEYTVLHPIASHSDVNIDTSHLNKQELYNLIADRFRVHSKQSLQLLLQSFGFKHGVPPDADFVLDVRCLPNPYWIPELRSLTGQDLQIVKFLEGFPEVFSMLTDVSNLLKNWFPRFKKQNRSYLTVAIGCTGGRHRSVYFIEQLAQQLGLDAVVRHRDIQRESH